MIFHFLLKSVILLLLATFVILFDMISNPYALSLPNQNLKKRYIEIENKLRKNTSSLPIYIESFDENHILVGDVYSIISQPFARVSTVLIDPKNWCDISLLHLNIKACTYINDKDIQKITIYSGRKFYQPPEDAFVIEYQFKVVHTQSHYLNILLTADSGPLDTTDYRIELEAIPVKGNKTFIRFSYTYTYGLATQTAMEAYFATLGRNKIGFNIINQDKDKNPVFIHGTRGAIERNSVRYYFAFLAYLDTLRIPEKNRFEQRIELWYSLTDRFKKQLFELSREEYIRCKKLELQNQIKLQEQEDQNLK